MGLDPQRILYEDNHLIAVNKLPSDIVQGDRTGDPTLADEVRAYLKEKYGKPGNVYLGIPHRLDRPTSGVVLFARTEKALARLSEMFRNGDVRKSYWALVTPRPSKDTATLVHWLVRRPDLNKSFANTEKRTGAREARLTDRVAGSTDRWCLLEIDLQTGRHHQIRAQLAAIGCSIKGDLKYGAARSNPGGGIHLHARRAAFAHPVRREPVVITADPPRDPAWDAAREVAARAAGAGGAE
jgi:23S rRNA pseudouridine1911/1915/1917 synthase